MRAGIAVNTLVPIQPYLYTLLDYQERIIRWTPYSKKNLALCYQFRVGAVPPRILLVPDACIDFLFCCDSRNPTALVRGMQIAPQTLDLAGGATYFGFKVYTAKGMRAPLIPWGDLVGGQCTLELLFPQASFLAERLAEEDSFEERVAQVACFALKSLAAPLYRPDFVEFSELRICASRGNLDMRSFSADMGYSPRYCREKFKAFHGISPKQYASVIRFQNVVRTLSCRAGQPALAGMAVDNGYFDQAHLTREFRRFCGDTPQHLRQMICESGGAG